MKLPGASARGEHWPASGAKARLAGSTSIRLVRAWGEVLKAIRADGTLQRLIERYVDAEEAAKMLAP